MLPREKILRALRSFLIPGIGLVLLAACSSNPGPAPASAPVVTGKMVSFNELAALQYYVLKDTPSVALEFYDGRTIITDIRCNLQMSSSGSVLHVHIYGDPNGPLSPKLAWNTDGNAYYYFDTGAADKAKMRVEYDDDQGPHSIPFEGVLDQPFESEHSTAAKASTTDQP